MKTLAFSILFICSLAWAEPPDSLRTSPADLKYPAVKETTTQVERADSLKSSTSATQSWLIPLAVVVTVGTAFVLMFSVRSR